jgi:prepilin-type N-terminal cleavage/methylation domain-containing protein
MFHRVQSNGMTVIDTTQRRQELAVSRRNEAGFTLLEVLVVVALLGTLAAMAIMVSPAFLKTAKADAGIEQAMDTLRLARETAISQRRNVRVVFVGLDAIQTTREDIGANGVVTGTTVLRTVQLENRMQFRVVSGVPNTPDAFSLSNATASGALAFGTSTTRMFTSEGTFVNQAGDVLNGTIFLSIQGDSLSARAITIFGPTALIRAWRWNGRDWVE